MSAPYRKGAVTMKAFPAERRQSRVAFSGMANVMIRCPQTGTPVPTGIAMDFEGFKRMNMQDNVLGHCPACGADHLWQGEDAFPDS
jgi:hypothetical protein